MATKVLKMTKTPIKNSTTEYRKSASSQRSSLNKGLRSLKGDTTQIKSDTSELLYESKVIQAQNTITQQGIQTATENQIKLFGLGNKSLMSIGAVGSAVGGLSIALNEGLKDILIVQVVIGLLLAVALVGIALYVNERLKKQEKVQNLIAQRLGIEIETSKEVPVVYMPNEISNPQANPISEEQ